MTTNTPNQLDHTTPRLPVVITGTMPRDDETLKLVRYLNELSADGKIDVYYYPGNDSSDPILTNVSDEKDRVVNPVRVPEDLQVASGIGGSDPSMYYLQVRTLLRNNGTPCVALAYPKNSDTIITTLSFKFEGQYTDVENEFSRGKLCTCDVHYDQRFSFLDAGLAMQNIDPANIAHMQMLSGPTYTEPKYDRAKTKADALEEIKKVNDGTGFVDDYMESLVDHLIKQTQGPLVGISSTTPLVDAGVEFDLHNSTKKMTKNVIEQIGKILGRDPKLDIAHETAATIVAEAERTAQGILESAQREADETRDELLDGAIEAANLIPELPQMLVGPLSHMVTEQNRRERERQAKEGEVTRARRVEVKNYLDSIDSSLEDLASAQLTGWGHAWPTDSFKHENQRCLDAIEKIWVRTSEHVSPARELHAKIDESNLGYSPLTLEEAVTAIGASRFLDRMRSTDAGYKLQEWNDEDFSRIGMDDWTLDQAEVDHAVFRAFVDHARTTPFTETDREFIATCDHVLEGELAASLSRSIKAHAMEDAFDELSEIAGDQPGESENTDHLIGQIESIAQSGRTFNGGQLEGHLAATMLEVERAASAQTISPSSPWGAVDELAHALESQPVAQQAQRMMRSDGTVVDIGGR